MVDYQTIVALSKILLKIEFWRFIQGWSLVEANVDHGYWLPLLNLGGVWTMAIGHSDAN